MVVSVPDRILRSGVIGSEKMVKVCDQAALLYDRILLIADDFGMFELAPMSLKMRAVPGRDSYTIERIEECCAELINVGLLRVWAIDGKQYAAVTKWEQTRWSKVSKLPMPPWGEDHITGGYVHPRARKPITPPVSSQPKKAKGAKSNGKKSNGNGTQAEFSAFYAAYPRHEDEVGALAEWLRQAPDHDVVAMIMASIELQKQFGCLRPGIYIDGRSAIPYPANWLAKHRWTDKVDTSVSAAQLDGRCAKCHKPHGGGWGPAPYPIKGIWCNNCLRDKQSGRNLA